MKLKTLPNAHPKITTKISVITPLFTMCPRSRNPQSGSTITISYHPDQHVIEVYSIESYLCQYIGGREMADGVVIRDMEQTIQQIALDCREVLEVDVIVVADLRLQKNQQMIVEVSV